MSHVVTAKIYDLATNALADISAIALEKTMTRRLNGPRGFTIQAPSAHSLLTTVAGDGYPNLRKGNRKLLVWEDGTIIFHGRIFGVERNGDGTKELTTITAWDPWMELGFDSEDRAGRPVRDATGNLISPTFTSSVGGQTEISGPDLIKQVLTNSQVGPAAETPGPGGEGPLPIDLTTGTFDTVVPPAVDLRVLTKMGWPVLIGDFIQQLVDTNVVDVNLRAVDPVEGLNNYKMAALSAVSSFGTDRHATVHFDYRTGSKNAIACRHVEDFSTINNKLYDYLGPPQAGNTNRFQAGNITPGSSGTTTDPSASRALYGGPGGGCFMSIRIFDVTGKASAVRPLYLALWDAEQRYRREPRNLLYITPAPDAEAIYEAPHDFDVGDLISINTGADFGVTLAQSQRVHGYDRSWNREGVATVSQLITSADIA